MRKPKSNRNKEIRQLIIDSNLHYIDIADALNIGYSTFSEWLRRSECGGHKEDIIDAISILQREGVSNE